MKPFLKINNPCFESWDDMQDIPEGKFCEICSKNVIDFNLKTEEEILKIFNDGKDKEEICGRIAQKAYLKTIATSILLITSASSFNAQETNNIKTITEQKSSQEKSTIVFSGILVYKNNKKPIANAEIYFIHYKKYIRALSNENGFFSLIIPNELVDKKNAIYINFDRLNSEKNNDVSTHLENEQRILSKEELVNNKIYDIQEGQHTIGAVVLTLESPIDLYYFDGKRIGENKFKKLVKENPTYQKFYFTDEIAKVISKKVYLDGLNLLFSN